MKLPEVNDKRLRSVIYTITVTGDARQLVPRRLAEHQLKR